MHALTETALNGVLLGSLYALFGLGLSLSLGVMRIINIAHGDLIIVAAYVASTLMQWLGCSVPQCLIILLPAMFALGWVLQWTLFNRVVGRGPLPPLLLTFGLSIVIQNVLREVYTSDTDVLHAGDLAQKGFEVGTISIGVLPAISASVSVLLLGLTHLLIKRTHLGRQARAVADDRATARLVGVNDSFFFATIMGFIFATIAVAGVLYGLRTPFTPSSGPERLLYSFEAVVLGGLGNLWGTLVGGLVIGTAQVFGGTLSSGLGPFFGHLVFLVALILRPQGLFQRST